MAIITISREMGSGGIPIAHKAAEKLGYTLVDGEMLMKVAEKYGLSAEALEKADEKPPAFVEKQDSQVEVDLHQIELIILEYALKGNVIIYGRGGQDLLQEIDSVFRVRVIAPFDLRVERWAEREWLDPDLARKLVRRSDQQRAGFIKYYFDRDWEDPLGYDLIINTERITEETAVQLICEGVADPDLQENKAANKKILKDLILRKRIEMHFDPLPFFSEPLLSRLVDTHEYPLNALTQRPMAMYHSWDSQNAWLRQIHTHNYLFVNPALAHAKGIDDGDWIWVESPTGKVRCMCRYSEAVEPGTVWTWNAIGKAAGAWGLSPRANESQKGFLLNHLIPEELPPCESGEHLSNSDPVTGQAAWFDVRVKIYKAGPEEPALTSPQFTAMKPLPGQKVQRGRWLSFFAGKLGRKKGSRV